MKKLLNMCMAAAMTVAMLAGCTGATKDLSMPSDNETAMTATLQQQNEMSELVGTLNDVMAELDKINGEISLGNGEANQDLQSKREEILRKLSDISDRIDEKQREIDELQKKYSGVLAQNAELKKTVTRMQGEITTYVERIKNYESALATKDATIRDLQGTLSSTDAARRTAEASNAAAQETLSSQDKMLNTGFFLIATSKELKQMGVARRGNIESGFDKSVFTKIDIRNVKEFALESRKAEVLSNMPEDSYHYEEQADRSLNLVVDDPTAFWSVTRYLVVQVK